MSALTLMLTAVQTATAAVTPLPVPFKVGERFEYSARWSLVTVGRTSIEVVGIDTVRGTPAYHIQYRMEANAAPFYRATNTLESWTSLADLYSLRFRQDNLENSRRFIRQFEIFPDSATYRQIEPDALAAQPGVGQPLDDASVLFFLRSTPLAVGTTYRFNRYFRADRNPIVVKVLKRETMELPDGSRVSCLVLNPIVGERGLFGPRTDARLWLSDDARRIPVQIRSVQPWGQVTMRLQRMVLAE
jgi:hypothetical protein